MRIPLVLVCLFAMTIPPVKANNHSRHSDMTSAQSSEVQSLKTDAQSLQKEIDQLRGEQDKWNTRYMRLGIAAVFIGGLLGLLSWISQNQSSRIALRSRPVEDALSAKNLRLRQLQDSQYGLDIANAQITAQKASEGAAAAVLEQTKLTAKNLELQSKVELERTARLAIEEKMRPRTISLEQSSLIAEYLSKFSGHSVGMTCSVDDDEAFRYANDLSNVLKKSGWFLEPEGVSRAIFSGSPRGLII